MTDGKKECAALIYDSTGWHRYPCSKPAKYHEDGKDWCGTHLPSRIEAKRAASAAKWEAEWAAKKAAREHEAVLTAAREAVIQAAKAWQGAEVHSPAANTILSRAVVKLLQLEGEPT